MQKKPKKVIRFDTQKNYDKYTMPELAFNWTFGTDLQNKPKAALTMSSDSCMMINTKLREPVSLISLNLLHTYVNISRAEVSLLQPPSCQKRVDKSELDSTVPFYRETVNCKWDDKSSQSVTRMLNQDLSLLSQRPNCPLYIRICSQGDSFHALSKLKLFGIEIVTLI